MRRSPVRFGYHAPASDLFEPAVTRVQELGPRALAQIDVRSIAGLPADADGLATGYMVAPGDRPGHRLARSHLDGPER